MTKTQAELLCAYIDLKISESTDVQAAYERGRQGTTKPSLATYLALMDTFDKESDFTNFNVDSN